MDKEEYGSLISKLATLGEGYLDLAIAVLIKTIALTPAAWRPGGPG